MTTQTASRFEVYESIAAEVCRLDRLSLIARLTHFEGNLTLDFSAEYLEACSTDQIRHLLVAALWRCRVKKAEFHDGEGANSETHGDS